jgi:hypothetical protein
LDFFSSHTGILMFEVVMFIFGRIIYRKYIFPCDFFL